MRKPQPNSNAGRGTRAVSRAVSRSVTFNYYWQGVKAITVNRGAIMNLDTGKHANDEGWDRQAARFEFDGKQVFLTRFSEGRDCDGYMSDTQSLSCPVADLDAHRNDGIGFPKWSLDDQEIYDEEAQKAGY